MEDSTACRCGARVGAEGTAVGDGWNVRFRICPRCGRLYVVEADVLRSPFPRECLVIGRDAAARRQLQGVRAAIQVAETIAAAQRKGGRDVRY